MTERPEYETARPDYKSHPLWNEAIALTHAAYELAERIRPSDPNTARYLRKAAVAIPAHVAGALSSEEEESRREHVATARGALAEVSRQAGRAGAAERAAAADLARRAGELERAVSFQLGEADGVFC
ncbi:MAG TPA: four helix bundle protein [Thermoanaerobaculia bacterium]